MRLWCSHLSTRSGPASRKGSGPCPPHRRVRHHSWQEGRTRRHGHLPAAQGRPRGSPPQPSLIITRQRGLRSLDSNVLITTRVEGNSAFLFFVLIPHPALQVRLLRPRPRPRRPPSKSCTSSTARSTRTSASALSPPPRRPPPSPPPQRSRATPSRRHSPTPSPADKLASILHASPVACNIKACSLPLCAPPAPNSPLPPRCKSQPPPSATPWPPAPSAASPAAAPRWPLWGAQAPRPPRTH